MFCKGYLENLRRTSEEPSEYFRRLFNFYQFYKPLENLLKITEEPPENPQKNPAREIFVSTLQERSRRFCPSPVIRTDRKNIRSDIMYVVHCTAMRKTMKCQPLSDGSDVT